MERLYDIIAIKTDGIHQNGFNNHLECSRQIPYSCCIDPVMKSVSKIMTVISRTLSYTINVNKLRENMIVFTEDHFYFIS